MEPCVDDSSEQESAAGEARSVVLGAWGKDEREYRADDVVVLGFNAVLVGLLALAVLVTSKGVTVATEFPYFSCRAERKVQVYA